MHWLDASSQILFFFSLPLACFLEGLGGLVILSGSIVHTGAISLCFVQYAQHRTKNNFRGRPCQGLHQALLSISHKRERAECNSCQGMGHNNQAFDCLMQKAQEPAPSFFIFIILHNSKHHAVPGWNPGSARLLGTCESAVFLRYIC